MPPIFALVAAVVSGILAARVFQFSILVWWSALGIALALTFWKSLRSWPIFAAFLCLAGLRLSMVEHRLLQDPLRPLNGQKIILQVHRVGESVSKPSGERYLADATQVYWQGKWQPIQTHLLVYSEKFSEDDRIIAEGDLEDLPPKLGFYGNQGCHHAFWVSKMGTVPSYRGQVPLTIVNGTCPHFTIRDHLGHWLWSSLLPPYNSIAQGVILGSHSGIPRDVLDEFRVTGTYHVLVASGLKVALVAGGVWLLTWLCPFHFRLAASALGVLFYAWLVGFEPPVMRASLMALSGLTAFLLGRGKDSLGAFFLSALVLLFIDPLWLFDVGFQLSFLSVLGILLFFEPISKKLQFFSKWIADSIAVTLSAQLLILIPLALYFHNISFVSPLANLLVVPLTALSMFLGSLSFGLSFLWKPLGFAIAAWHQIVLMLMLWIVEACSRVPWAYLWVSRPGLFTGLFVYLIFFGFTITNRKIRTGVVAASSCLLVALWMGRMVVSPAPRIAFLDVGQGDCALLSFGRKNYLVDGGGSSTEIVPNGFSVGENVVVPALRERGINRLDGILLTHPHRDHVGGLVAVLQQFPVNKIWLPALDASSPVYETFLKEARDRKIPLFFVQGNEKIQLGKYASVYIYWPVPPLLRGTDSDLNNNSVVSQWVIQGIRILLSGDVEIEGEGGVLERLHPKSLLQSQILKVPHHGSGTSSTADFLRAASPRVAVVSVGARNLYHHPSPATMRRLHRKIPYVFRTDEDGTVEFILHSTGPRPWVERIP